MDEPLPDEPLTPAELLEIRTSRGLSQTALSALIGVDSSTVSRWESRNRVISLAYSKLIRAVVVQEVS